MKYCPVSENEWENGERTGSDIDATPMQLLIFFSPFLVLRLLTVSVTVTIGVVCGRGYIISRTKRFGGATHQI